MVRQWQEFFYGNRYAESYVDALPDFAKLAEAFGADGIKVTKMEHAGAALREALANNRPTVLEVPIPRLPSPFVP